MDVRSNAQMPKTVGCSTPLHYQLGRGLREDADLNGLLQEETSLLGQQSRGNAHKYRPAMSPHYDMSPLRRPQHDAVQAHGGHTAMIKRSAAPPPPVRQAMAWQNTLTQGSTRHATPSPSRTSAPAAPQTACHVLSNHTVGSSPARVRGTGSLPPTQLSPAMAVSSSAVDRFHMALAGSPAAPVPQMRGRVAVSSSPPRRQHCVMKMRCGASCEPAMGGCNFSPRANLDAMSYKTPPSRSPPSFMHMSPRMVETVNVSGDMACSGVQHRTRTPVCNISPRREVVNLSGSEMVATTVLPQRSHTPATPARSMSPQRGTVNLSGSEMIAATGVPHGARKISPRREPVSLSGSNITVMPGSQSHRPIHNASAPAFSFASPRVMSATQARNMSQASFSHAPRQIVDLKQLQSMQSSTRKATDQAVSSIDSSTAAVSSVTCLDNSTRLDVTVSPEKESPPTTPHSPTIISRRNPMNSISQINLPKVSSSAGSTSSGLSAMTKCKCPNEALQIFNGALSRLKALESSETQDTDPLSAGREEVSAISFANGENNGLDFQGGRNNHAFHSPESSPLAQPPESARLRASSSVPILISTPILGSPANSSLPEEPGGSCFVSVPPLLGSPSSAPDEHGANSCKRNSPSASSPCWMEVLDPNGNVGGLTRHTVTSSSITAENLADRCIFQRAAQRAQQASDASSLGPSCSGSVAAGLEVSVAPGGSERSPLESISHRTDVSDSNLGSTSERPQVSDPKSSKAGETSYPSGWEPSPPSKAGAVQDWASKLDGLSLGSSTLPSDNKAPNKEGGDAALNNSHSEQIRIDEKMQGSLVSPEKKKASEGPNIKEARELQLWAQAQVLEQECKQLGRQLANAEPGRGKEESAARALLAAHAAFSRLDMGLQAHTEGRSHKVERLTKELRNALDSVARAAAPVFEQSEGLVNTNVKSIDFAHLFNAADAGEKFDALNANGRSK